MRKLSLLFIALIYLAGLVYVLQPTPPVPDLPQSLRSDEPGDTWQNPTQKAFYTNLSRDEVMTYYANSYRLSLGSTTLPLLRFNYPPEETGQYVRKHIETYWLEELVHPIRESIFIAGWTRSLAPQTAHLPQEAREKLVHVIDGQTFKSKITIRWYDSPLWARVLVWTLIFPLTYLLFNQLQSNLVALKNEVRR